MNMYYRKCGVIFEEFLSLFIFGGFKIRKTSNLSKVSGYIAYIVEDYVKKVILVVSNHIQYIYV